MADSAVPVSGGSGYNVDTRTESINGDHRQVVVLGDPVTGANVVTVDASGRASAAVSGLPVSGPTAATISTSGNTYTMTVGAAGNITFWFYNTAANTTSGGVWVFEQSFDGTNWAALAVVRSDTNVVGTSVSGVALSQNQALAFDAAMEGVNFARVRCTTTGTNVVTCVGAGGGMPFSPVVSIGNSPAVTANPPGVTRGTQSTTGYTVQPLRDAGRTVVTFAAIAVAGVTTEALVSGTFQRGTTQVSTTATTITVASGKTMRIQSLDVSIRLGAAAVGWSRFVLRSSLTTSATSTTSPVLAALEIGPGSAAVANAVDRTHLDFPDGLELAGGTQWGITHIGSATSNIETVTLTAFEY